MFSSLSNNLVPHDRWVNTDVFLHDTRTGDTTLVDVNDQGQQSDAGANWGVISGDGRTVAFESGGRNLDPRLRGFGINIYLRDLQRGTTRLVSVNGLRTMGGTWPSLSHDGQRVAFESPVDLLPQDTNGLVDVYVKDVPTQRLFLASTDSHGALADGASSRPALSGDGRYVAFESAATNLVPGDVNGVQDVFVHDLFTGITTRVSVSSADAEAQEPCRDPSLSLDGQVVLFSSRSANLVPGDTNRAEDVFRRDRRLGLTRRISTDSQGVEGNGRSYLPRVSADGRYGAFHSDADNLVSNDTNGTGDSFVHGPLLGLDGPSLAWVGSTATLTLWGGAAGDPALLAVTAVGDRPAFLVLRAAPLDAQGRLALSGPVPPAALGLTVTFQGLALSSTTGGLEASGLLTLRVALAHDRD